MAKKTIETEINDFFEIWGQDELIAFLADIFPLIQLYHVDEDDDWVKDAVGEDDLQNVRLIRTAYLISMIAEKHGGRLASTNAYFRKLWDRLEKS